MPEPTAQQVALYATDIEARRCEIAGALAFHDPRQYRIPILDPTVAAILNEHQPTVGQPITMQLFEAFTRGWDSEALQYPAPTEDVTP